jgi:ParB family chromosome partitioning protein
MNRDFLAEYGELARVEVGKIDTGIRLRRIKWHRVEVLRHDIEVEGLLAPVVVVARGERFLLVDGRHRLEAVRKLGWNTIPALVLPEDTEDAVIRFGQIMANVNREDLTKLERCEHLAALRDTWNAINPSARHGGDRRSAAIRQVKEAQSVKDDGSPILGLLVDVAKKVGLSRTAFFRAIQINTGLADATKDRLRDTWIEDHQAGLQTLSELDPETQAKVCDLLLSDPPGATCVADAVLLAQGRLLPRPDDKFYLRLQSNWARMAKPTRDAWIDEHKREIMDVARAKGWSF